MKSPRSESGTYRAPAKVNVRLEVLNKRGDGYHEIRSVMCPVGLYDEVTLRPTGSGITLTSDTTEIPSGNENLAYKAASLLMEKSPIGGGVCIHLLKRIPIAAGLGGGSSDAAAVMRGMNDLYGLNCTPRQLMELGSSIGSDVPFFFMAGPALATGRGEILSTLGLSPPLWLLLVTPPLAVSTAWAYSQFSPKSGEEFPYYITQAIDLRATGKSILRNDLEEIVTSRYPEINEVKDQLGKLNAWGSMMSGSGPTVFGIFFEEEEARKAERELVKGYSDRSWRISVAKALT